jgi:hypothetical protein
MLSKVMTAQGQDYWPTIKRIWVNKMTAKHNSKRVKQPTETGEPYLQNAVNLRQSDWELLRHVAEARFKSGRKTGRVSMSAVIASLIDERRTKLMAELKATK